MNKPIRNLCLLRGLGNRLASLAKVRGNPKNVVKQHLDESDAIAWAFSELRKEHLARLIICYGNKDNIDFQSLIPNMKVVENDGMIMASELQPDNILVEKMFDDFDDFRGREEIEISLDKCPEWLFCDTAFVVRPSKVIFIDSFLDRKWLSESGLGKARFTLMSWLLGLYNSL